MPANLKARLAEHPRLAGTAAAIVIAITWLWLSRGLWGTRLGRSAPMPPAYYYDLATGHTFVAPFRPPYLMHAPGGGACVRAAVYSCGACDEPHRFVAWLETEEAVEGEAPATGPEAETVWLAAMKGDLPESDDAEPSIRPLLRSTDDEKWQLRTEERLEQFRVSVAARCADEGGRAAACLPR